MRHIYSVLRFVPDPAKGEFVNVGAIAGSEDSSEWKIRLIDNPKRARHLDDLGVLSHVWEFANEIGDELDGWEESRESLFDAETELDEGWLMQLHERMQNIVQLSRPTPIVAESADAALDMVFSELVVDPERASYSFDKKFKALGAIKQAYREVGIRKGRNLFERPIISGQYHSEPFDLLVRNGRVVQLTQAYSFQLPNQEELAEKVKAWAFTVEDVRDHGGRARLGDSEATVSRDVNVGVVYVPPVPGGPTQALEEALAAFGKVGAQAVEASDAAHVAEVAAGLMG